MTDRARSNPPGPDARALPAPRREPWLVTAGVALAGLGTLPWAAMILPMAGWTTPAMTALGLRPAALYAPSTAGAAVIGWGAACLGVGPGRFQPRSVLLAATALGLLCAALVRVWGALSEGALFALLRARP